MGKAMKKSKRFLACLLAFVMLFQQTTLTSFAEEAEVVTEVQSESVQQTKTTAPETMAPETTAPETTAPETTAPETTAPETTAPETTAPETTAPETTAPETAASETAAPETTVSETTVPDETTEIETTTPETGASDERIETNAPETEAAEDESESESESVRENVVTFKALEGGVIIKVDDKDVTNSTAKAKDGKIVFSVLVQEGYEVTDVLVDDVVPARKNEATEDPDDYVIEGIQTDSTVVTVKVQQVETESEEVPARKMMRSMIMRAPGEMVDVVLKKLTKEGSVDGTVSVDAKIQVGAFADTATSELLEGHESEFPAGINYTFAYAVVNNVKITSVAVEVDEEGEKTTYVSIGNDGYSDMALSGTSPIELYFQETPAKYSIQCDYTLEGYTIENSDIKPMTFSLNDVEGKVEQGKDIVINTLYTAGFGFLDISKVEYTVNNVKKELGITEGQSTFTIPKEDIQGDVNVNFTLKKHEQTYNVHFMGANSHWTSGDWNWDSSQGEYSKGSTLNMGTYDLSGDGKKSLTFTFNAYQQWGDMSVNAPNSYYDYTCPAKSLNKIVLSIGKNSNKFAVEDRYITLPEAREGATATTSLRNGATVTVKCVREGFAQGQYAEDKSARLNQDNLPKYEVTITAGEGRILYGDIEIETNFKDSTTWEVWVTDLTGMTCLNVDDYGEIISSGDSSNRHGYVNYDGYPYNDLRPKNGVYYQRFESETRTVRGNILPGYSINPDDFTVTIVKNNVADPPLDKSQFKVENNDGQWQFVYTITDTVSTDFRISVSTKYNNFKTFYTEDQTVTADNYQDNKDKFAVNMNDPGKYGHFETDNTGKVVYNVGNYIPEKEGYVFDYWEAIFSEDKFYPGATVNVNSADHSLLNDPRRFNAETNGYEFYLRAHFVQKPESEMTDYKIKLTFAGVQGEFEIPDQGVKNTTAKVKEQKLKAYINEHYRDMGLPANWEDFFTWDSKKAGNSGIGVIQGDHNTVIPVAFDMNPLVIAGKSDKLEYNGTEQSVTGFAAEENGKGVVTINGHKYYVEGLTHTASGTNVSGSPYNGITTGTEEITDASGANVTSYFDGVTVTPGTLTITPKAVTIRVNNAEKYEGEADPTFDGTVEGLIGSDQIGTVTYSRTNTNVETVGSYSEVITANVTDANPNYTFTVVPGNFEIKAGSGALEVTKSTTSTPADGKAYTAGETITYSITVKNTGNVTLKDVVVKDILTNGNDSVGTIGELAPNATSIAFTVSHVVTGAEAKAGKVTNVATAEGTTPVGDIVNGSGQKEDSAAQIPVTIKVNDAAKIYGAVDPAFSGTITGLRDNDTLNVRYSRTGNDENAGTYSNVLTATYDNNDKYAVTVETGTFTITPAPLTVKTSDATKIYDGTELMANGEVKGLVNGETVDFKTTGKQITVGNSTNTYELKWTGTAKESNYEIKEETLGTLTITPKAVVIKVNDSSKYRGQNDPVFTGNVEGMVTGDSLGTITYSRTNTDEEVSVYTEVLTATVANPNPNYTYTVEKGDFEIKDGTAGLTVSKTTVGSPEDGKAYTAGETITYSITVENTGNVTLKDVVVKDTLTNGNDSVGTIDELAPNATSTAFTVSHVVTGAEAKAGKVINVATAEGTTPAGDTVNGSGQKEDSAAQIPVRITVHDASKVYGAADPAFSGTITGLRDNDTLNVRYSRTGNDENTGTYSNVLTAAYDNNDKYAVTVETGTFTITPQSITPGSDPENPDPSYDGIEVGYPNNTVYNGSDQKQTLTVTDKSGNSLTEGTDYTIEYSSDVKNVGDVTVTVKGIGNYTGTVKRTYKITPASLTVKTLSASKKYDGDPLTKKEGATITGLVGQDLNADGTGKASLDVNGKQTLVGSSENTCDIIWGTVDDKNYTVTKDLGTLEVTDDTDGKNVIHKTHDSKTYAENEVITFAIKVKNIYDKDKTITVSEIPGVTITEAIGGDVKEGKAVFEKVTPGSTVSVTAVYTVTKADIEAGKFDNTATADFSDGGSFNGDDTVDKFAHLTVTKTAGTIPEGGHKLNDLITYTILVKNDGTQPISNIIVTDDLTGDTFGPFALEAGKSEELTAEYEVTSEDILKGKITNVAVAVGKDPDGDEVTDRDEVTTDTEEINTALVVTKTSDVKEGETAKLDQVISYTILVENKGNVPYTDIVVEDKLVNAKIVEGEGYKINAEGKAIIEKLAVDESVEIYAVYKVTEEDITIGHVDNVATAKGNPVPDPDPQNPPKTPEGEGEEDDPTDPRNPKLEVTKEVTSKAKAEDGKYALGETITYKVTVKNVGNLTLKEVKVSDVITRPDGSTVVPSGFDADKAVIGKLEAGKSAAITYTHVVEEADLGGILKNAATATGKPEVPNPDPGKPEPEPEDTDEKEVPTDPCAPKLEVTKEVTSKAKAEDGKYALGETITYKVTVTNTGNLTLRDIKVTDILTRPDGSQTVPSGLDKKGTVLKSLAPNESQTITYIHKVTEKDMGGELMNAATATASNPDSKNNLKVEGTDEETVTTKNAETPGTKKNETKKAQTVKTGDNTLIWPFVVLFAAAALVVVLLLVFKRRRKAD